MGCIRPPSFYWQRTCWDWRPGARFRDDDLVLDRHSVSISVLYLFTAALMAHVGKLEVGWNGLLESLTSCVTRWRPAPLSREIDYSRALASYLREVLPADSLIENEYRHLGETLDVYVRYEGIIAKSEVFVEVKRCLRRKPDFNRLVGQVMSLQPGKNKILLVLIGECDIELIGRLRLQFKQHLERGPFITDVPTLSIVQVPESTGA